MHIGWLGRDLHCAIKYTMPKAITIEAIAQSNHSTAKYPRVSAPMTMLHSFIAAIMPSFTSLTSGVSSNSEKDRHESAYNETLA